MQTEVDIQFFIEFPELGVVKLFTQISYYGHQGTESVVNVLFDEARGICLGYLGKGFCFHPPGEVVYCHYGMLGLTRSSREWPDKIQTTDSKMVRCTD